MKNKIQSILRESLNKTIIENLIDEDYPINFNMDEFKGLITFKDRITYCDNNLKKISSGSGRIVYMIDDIKVLKLSKNSKGVAQTKTESEWGQDSYFSNILAHTFDFHPEYLWIEMELARKVTRRNFIEIAECSIDNMSYYLRNDYSERNGQKPLFGLDKDIKAELDENHFVSLVKDFMGNTQSDVGDFGRLNSYGLVNRNGVDDIVIIDFGLTNDIYDTYYS